LIKVMLAAPGRTKESDAARNDHVDLVEVGIIGPAEVVHVALEKRGASGEPVAVDRGDDDRDSRTREGTRGRARNGDVTA
jgi:hypothetical protein